MKTDLGFASFSRRTGALIALVVLGVACGGPFAQASKFPEIRLSQRNLVPACVTPDRLMVFLRQRNDNLDPRFRNIAHFYRQHGEAWRVRWDYAFFQMAIETNFLTYRRPNGKMGDVDPRQNNFAGIGTTGGGVPGDSFPDVSTGVLGQIQHLVVYSGEMVDEPVASRTRLKQKHILALSRKLNRPVLWSDLARRWAVDPKYANSIEWVAGRYRDQFCGPNAPPAQREALPWQHSDARRGEPSRHPVAIALPKRKSAAIAAPVSVLEDGAGDVKTKRVQVVDVLPAASTPAQEDPAVDGAETGGPAPAGTSSAFALFSPPSGFLGIFGSATTEAEQQPAEPDPQSASSDSTVGGFVMAGAGGSNNNKPAFDPPSGLGVKPGRCVIETATYGGETTVLLKTRDGEAVHYVALSVLDGFEETMTNSYLSARPEGGERLGTYPSREIALKEARGHCPEAG